MKKPILDACCGARMFWFDKDNPLVDFMDIRDEVCVLSDGQIVNVQPNIVGDYRNMPMYDKSYKLVVWDPPHLVWAGKASNLCKKFGKLDNDWKTDLKKGFDECMRVLDDYGVLILKWSEVQLKVKSIIKAIGHVPLFGHKTNRHTIWLCYMKTPDMFSQKVYFCTANIHQKKGGILWNTQSSSKRILKADGTSESAFKFPPR